MAIRIEAQRHGDELRIRIHNTGRWIASESSGIGLRNCRERLALVYGDKASLTLGPGADGIAAVVTLPFLRP